jgi:hypothetical protein
MFVAQVSPSFDIVVFVVVVNVAFGGGGGKG